MSSEGRTSSRQRQPAQPFSPAEFEKRRQAPAPKPSQGIESLNNASQHPTPDKNPAHRNTQPNPNNISKDAASQYSDEDNARLNRLANSSTQSTPVMNTSSFSQSPNSSAASSSTSSSERAARLRDFFEDIKVLSEDGNLATLFRDIMPQIQYNLPLPPEQSRARETPNQKFEREQKEKSLEIIIGKTYPSPKDEDDEKSHYPEGHEEQLHKFCRYLLMQVATKKMRDFFPEGEEELQEETFHFLAHRLCFTKEFAHRKWATRRHQSKYQAKESVKAKAKEHQINTRKRQRGDSITDDNQSASKRRRTDSEDLPDSDSELDANSGEESEDNREQHPAEA